MITIGLLDDHPLIIAGIQRMFENDPAIRLRWAISQPGDLPTQLAAEPTDALLLDVNLTVADGLIIGKQLHQQYPALSIIMLTSYEETNLVRASFRNGAIGYVLKNAPYAELAEAIQTACRGERYVSRRLRDMLLEESLGQSANLPTGYMPLLTRRE